MASCVNRRSRSCWPIPGDETPPMENAGESPAKEGGGPVVLLLLLAPQTTSAPSSHHALAARGLRRELHAALRSAGGGLEVTRLVFNTTSPLAGRELLVITARPEVQLQLAESLELPKLLGRGAYTFWEPFSKARAAEFVTGSDDSFFTEAEVLELLLRGCNAVPTSCAMSSLSVAEAAALKNCRPHHSLMLVAEELGVVERVLGVHSPAVLQRLRANWHPWHPLREPPIEELVEYFGPYAVHYFVFMQEYARWLLVPAIVGACAALLLRAGTAWTWIADAWAFLLLSWATLFVEHWKRSVEITRRRVGPDRPHLEEELLEPLPLDTEADDMRAAHKVGEVSRLLRHGFAIATMCGLFATTTLVIHVLLYVGEVVEAMTDNIVLQNSPLLLYLAVITMFQRFYNKLAHWLTMQECHSIRSGYLRSLTMKSAIFALVNYHGWFLYLAFWKQDMDYLRSQLFTFFTVKQVIGNFVEVALPMIQAYVGRLRGRQAHTSVFENEQLRNMLAATSLNASEVTQERQKILREAAEQHIGLPESNLNDEYCEMAVMFAAATCYSAVFPLGTTFAFLHAIFEGGSDAYKLCGVTQRLLPKQADEDIVHVWVDVFGAINFFAVTTSLALIWLDNPGARTPMSLLIAEHVFFFFKGYLAWNIPDCPEWIQAENSRNRVMQRQGHSTNCSFLSAKAGPQMLQVRPVVASGLHQRLGGLLRRHPVVRLTHGGHRLDTKVEGDVSIGLPRTLETTSGSTASSRSMGSVTVTESSWSEHLWFSLPYRPGSDLIAEVLSIERRLISGGSYKVLGTAIVPKKKLPVVELHQGPSSFNLGAGAVTITVPLVGEGVDEEASLTLELRIL